VIVVREMIYKRLLVDNSREVLEVRVTSLDL
jgi:hypothetical protein